MYKILSKETLCEGTYKMNIYAPDVARRASAGQFIIFRTDEKGERIPLTIADYDRESGSVTIIFQAVGASTKKLGLMEEGDEILDFVGPLGNASEIRDSGKVAVIGGGLGCAIAYPQAKALFEKGCEVHIIAGFRNQDAVILEEDMREVCQNLVVMTDDGSYGKSGRVTDGLLALIESGERYDEVIAIGPPVMMKFVCELTRKHGIPTIVSLNPIMIDGTGMCGGCRVKVDGKMKFACVDGPDFDGHLVDFDELMRRNRMYVPHEREADCNLMSPQKTK